LLLGAITGCGGSRAEVSGTVRYDGKPLSFGTIQFLGPDGIPCAGQIQPDGTFSVQVPPGAARVIVSCSQTPMNRSAAAPSADRGRPARLAFSGSVSLIPQRYADWNTSGLSVQVHSGKTTQDFALTSR
jgi:hypothetical protein